MLASLLLAAVLNAMTFAPGEVLVYRGSLEARRAAGGDTRKEFELTALAASPDARADFYWTLTERGRGAWRWTDHFGRAAAGSAAASAGPALLYERAEGSSVVPLIGPWLATEEPLAAGKTWQSEKLDYRVQGAEKVGEVETWRVEVRNAYGLQRMLWIERNRPLIIRCVETVFLGQGEEHELRFELAQRRTLDESAQQATQAAFEKLLRLRTEMKIEPRSPSSDWKDEQLALLRGFVPELATLQQLEALAPLAKDMESDARTQRDRLGAVAALRSKLVGAAVPEFELTTLTGKTVRSSELGRKVVVLHFWEYRDLPLEEPYGQSAYLDFLARQLKSPELVILGVHVDDRLDDPSVRSRSVQSARKFYNFMNLSYPLLLDGGGVLRSFGDPRLAGARLPLFVVIGRDGKVRHYHVGHYDVQRDQGLEELNRVVKQALDDRG